MKKNILSWNQYQADAIKLARKIKIKPNLIVAISRGGLVVGVLLSHIMNKPLAAITATSYKGHKRDGLRIGAISSTEKIKGKVLLVDDLVDSGNTIIEIKKRLLKMEKVEAVSTAVLYAKPASKFTPDYTVRVADGWVAFPYEQKQRLN